MCVLSGSVRKSISAQLSTLPLSLPHALAFTAHKHLPVAQVPLWIKCTLFFSSIALLSVLNSAHTSASACYNGHFLHFQKQVIYINSSRHNWIIPGNIKETDWEVLLSHCWAKTLWYRWLIMTPPNKSFTKYSYIVWFLTNDCTVDI